MKVFVGGVSSEIQYAKGVLAFRSIKIRDGDVMAIHYGATGNTARKAVCSEFLGKDQYDALALFDLDMDFPPDVLERLRAHDVDMVCGHYYRRQLSPMMSLIETSPDGTWPYMPVVEPPTEGLHEIACAGFGCVLIKREVIEAVAKTLPPLSHPFDNGPVPWLTGDHLCLGTDKRFFALARKIGYKFYLDASIRCKHAVTLWLDDEVYGKLRDRRGQAKLLAGYWLESVGRDGVNDKTIKLRLQTLSLEREELLKEFDAIKEDKTLEELQPFVLRLNDYDSRMAECHDWITGFKASVQFPHAPEAEREDYKLSRTYRPAESAVELRDNVMGRVAADWVEMLDGRKKRD